MKREQLVITFKLLLIALLSACVASDGGRSGRPLIDAIASGSSTGGCNNLNFVFESTDTCVSDCGTGNHLATPQELAQLTISAEKQQIIDNSAGVCIKDTIKVTRPDLQITVEDNYCACVNGKPAILKECFNTCKGLPNDNRVLRGEVTVSSTIEINESLGNLHGWCNNIIPDGNENVSCVLRVTDGSRDIDLQLNTSEGKNTFNASLGNVGQGQLEFDTSYSARIVERSSGSRSKAFQFVIKDTDENSLPDGGLLTINPVTQYSCISRSGTVNGNENSFESAFRSFFYFTSSTEPGILPPSTPFIHCHDLKLGENDDITFPRIEQVPGQLTLWSVFDERMVDTDENGFPDINDALRNEILSKTGTNVGEIFHQFKWPNRPVVNSPEANGTDDNFSQTLPTLGIYMVPWTENGKAFCPRRDRLDDTASMFNVLSPYIGPTEGIYLAERAPLTFTQDGQIQNAPQNVIIIRESQLLKIGFYVSNQLPVGINETSLQTEKTVHFYWPPLEGDKFPFTKKGDQKLYTVRSSDQIGKPNSTGLQTTIKPVDKRIGCVPENASN